MADAGKVAGGAASGAAAGTAILPGWGTAIGAVAGGIMGLLSSAKERGASDEELAALMEQYQRLHPPDVQNVDAEQLGPSAYESIAVDPALKAAQYEALARMQQQGANGGNTLANQANLNQGQNEAYRQAMASRQSIQNNMAARGMSNSGASLAMQLGAVNAAQDRAGQESLQAAGNAQKNALQAIQNAGQLSSNMRTQQYGEDERRAHARDMMAQYNADSRQKAAYYNNDMRYKTYEEQLARLNGMRGATSDDVAQHNANANRTQGMWTDLGAGVGQIAGSLAGRGSAGTDGGAGTTTPTPQVDVGGTNFASSSAPLTAMDPNDPNSIAYKKKAGI